MKRGRNFRNSSFVEFHGSRSLEGKFPAGKGSRTIRVFQTVSREGERGRDVGK